MDALITYGGRISYSALRSLASLGLDVALADVGRIGMGQWSRFCKRSYICANPVERPETFVNDICRILGESGARFLLPGFDDVEVLAKYRGSLPEDVILPVASYEQIKMANDKALMASYARSMGLDVPEVIEWHNLDELEDKLRVVDFPLVVKLRTGDSATGVYYPANAGEALALCKDLAARYSLGHDQMPVVQRRVAGEKWGVACLYHEGKMLSLFTQKMLRQMPPTGGAGTLRVSARNAKIEAYSERLLDGLAWHGIALTEFIYDPGSKEAWFIEVNPRLWSSIHLAVAADIDLVALLYIASTEGPEAALRMTRPQKDGVLCRWWLGDVRLALSEARRLRPLKALKLFLPGGTDAYDELWGDDLRATAATIVGPVARRLCFMRGQRG